MVLSATAARALWVLPVGDLGGVARHALDVARVGVPGWRLEFLVPDGPVVAALREAGAEVTVARLGPAYGLRASTTALRTALRRTHPALVHTHLAYADVVAALAAPRGSHLVTTEHGIADDDLVYHGSRLRSRLRALAHRARLRRFDAFVAVSEATARVARAKWRIPATLPVHVLVNGIDHGGDHPSREPGLHVVSLARLAPEKRLPDLVDAFALVAAEHPEARLTLAGIGPLADDLARRVRRLGLADRVALPGFADAATLLAGADVLAQLSVWENCSYSLLDAMAGGLGVVASPVGGNVEMLPGPCLVDPADHAAVARALVTQGSDPASRPTLPGDWPDVATMTKLLGEVYAQVES